MRKKTKKLLSGLLSLAMILSLVTVSPGAEGSTVQAESSNLITNGDFETGSVGSEWKLTTDSSTVAMSVAAWAKETDTYGLVLQDSADYSEETYTGSDVTLTQTLSDLPAGSYTFTISVMGSGADSISLVVDGQEVADTTKETKKTWGTWETFNYSVDITGTGEHTIGIKTFVYAGKNSFCIDNVSLVSTTGQTGIELPSDDFSEDSGWSLTTDLDGTTNENLILNETSSDGCFKSGKGAEIVNSIGSDNNAYLTYKISSLPAGNYTFTAYGKGEGSKTMAAIVNGTYIEDTGATTTLGNWADGWKEITYTFTVKEDTENFVVGVYLWTYGWSGGKSYTYIDDISLVKNETTALTYSDLQDLISEVPSNYLSENFTASSISALTEALEAAQECDNETDVEELTTCYNNLKEAIDGLCYEDDAITVAKVDNLSDDFINGVDISSYITEVNSGVKFKDWSGKAIEGVDFIKLFADSGVNYIRLRIWNQPYVVDANGDAKTDDEGNIMYYGGGNNDLTTAKAICEYIAAYNKQYSDNIKVLIDFHYSDFWADPDKQTAPKQWAEYFDESGNVTDIEGLTAALTTYTTESLQTIKDTGVTIGMVQVGNETNNGICGVKISDSNYYAIIKAGCAAVKEFDSSILRAVHYTDPQTDSKAVNFAKQLADNGVDYDVYATSYYPYWHGTTNNLTTVLKTIADTYNKKVMVAETQYIYTNEDYDGADNQAYEGKGNIDLSGWPVSVQGQANEIRDVINAVASVGEAGIGMFYWEPAWLGVGSAYDENGDVDSEKLAANEEKWESYGSGWATDAAAEYDSSANKWGGGGTNIENAALFDSDGTPLASLNVFKYVKYGAVAKEKSYYSYKALDDISVTMGTSASALKDALTENASEVTYYYNDSTEGKAEVVWSTKSIKEVASEIKTTDAIGLTYSVTGTIEVDGNKYTVKCNVVVEPAVNLLSNGNFEETDSDVTGKVKDWTITAGDILYYDTENPRNSDGGCVAIHVYSDKMTTTPDENGCYTSTISQTVKLPVGVYEARAYFEGLYQAGSRDNESITISVSYGGNTLTSKEVILDDWMVWQCPVISNIEITDDMLGEEETVEVTVSATVTLSLNTWGSIDDFYLYPLSVDEEKATYAVNVTNGTADQEEYEAGDFVCVTADTKEGKTFKNWNVISGDVELDDLENEITYFTMPENNVELEAVYEDIPYQVTVNSGTIEEEAENYYIGDTVTIKAAEAPSGKVFDKWVVVNGTVSLESETSETTTFVMPAGDVEVTATYKDKVTENLENPDKEDGNASDDSEKNDAAAEPATVESATVGTTIQVADGVKGTFTVTNAGSTPEVSYTAEKNAVTINIPATVKDANGVEYKVTSIVASSFKGNKKLKSVTIGSNVTSIPANAFKGCTSLTSVKIPASVKTIGANAFSGDTKLKTVTMGSGVTTIGAKAFYNCKKLKKITLPKTVTKIGKQAFANCKALKTITIKSTKLTKSKVGSKAFKGINAKATIKVPKSKLKAYKTMLKSKGVGSKVKIKKN